MPANDSAFHTSFDHYLDNLSARQCHPKPLPCRLVDGKNTTDCVTQAMADGVYRLGNWEYSQVYRDDPRSLDASVGALGVWCAELAAHLRAVMSGTMGGVIWYHNIAHDGSVSRLLSVLQIDVMAWPGMGSEVLLELYTKQSGPGCLDAAGGKGTDGISMSGYYVRVLWGGQAMTSSNPSLGKMDMLPAETLLAYIDGLVGAQASKMVGLCDGSTPYASS